MPWYEREDFYRLIELAEDRNDMTADYDIWHSRATAVAKEFLAGGRALRIITIRPDEFLAWLDSQALPNISASRLRYVEMRAATLAAALADIATAAGAASAVAALRGVASDDQTSPRGHRQNETDTDKI